MSSAAQVHPKIRKRNAQVKEERKQRRVRVLITLVILIVLAGLTALALMSPFLDVDRVKLAGTDGKLAERVEKASGVKKGQPLIAVQVPEVQRNIEALPEISKAIVKVNWPHEVTMTVFLRSPIAAFEVDEKFMVVGDDGIVMETVKDNPGGVVVIQGKTTPTKTKQQVSGTQLAALNFVNGLNAVTRARITNVTIHSDGTLTAKARLGGNGSVTIKLGEPSSMDAKAVALETMLADVKLKSGDTIDVRSPRAPVITNVATTIVNTSTTSSTVVP